MKQSHYTHRGRRGFTIVELLIVVVVIGILASITIVSYNGVTNRAKESVLTSDLDGAYTQLAVDNLNDGEYPAVATASNKGQGLKSSNGTVLQYSKDAARNAYCLSASNGTLMYHIKSGKNVAVEGPCVSTQGVVTTLAGSGVRGKANGAGAAASFDYPYGITMDTSGNLYVADTYNRLIRKVTADGVVTTLAGSGVQGNADGTGTAASFNNPTGITIDGGGNLYVTDTEGHRIRKVTPAGVVTTIAGSGVAGATNATGTAATFRSPYGIAIDASGNLYVADTFNMLIRKITPEGVVTTLAGVAGTTGSANGTGTAASFNYPRGIAIDIGGNLYIADTNNHLIRKVTPAGVVSTFAGSGTQGAANGTGTAASFFTPGGTAVDDNGNVYVADMSNNLIRRVTPAGVVTTIAGTGTTGAANGTGTAASFNTPVAMIVDANGNVFVADTINSLIRKISS